MVKGVGEAKSVRGMTLLMEITQRFVLYWRNTLKFERDKVEGAKATSRCALYALHCGLFASIPELQCGVSQGNDQAVVPAETRWHLPASRHGSMKEVEKYRGKYCMRHLIMSQHMPLPASPHAALDTFDDCPGTAGSCFLVSYIMEINRV